MPGSRRLLDTRFMKIQTFDGDATRFDDWSFAFKRAHRAADRMAFDLLEKAQRHLGDIDEDIDFDEVNAAQYSAELFDILCQACQGGPLPIVRSVSDLKGLTAWNKLYEKYQPKTMARAIRLVGQVMSPHRIKDIKVSMLSSASGKNVWRSFGRSLEEAFQTLRT